jgi:hypothetical protein
MSSYVKTQHPEYGEVARKECPDPECGCKYANIKRKWTSDNPLHFECCECGTKFMDG